MDGKAEIYIVKKKLPGIEIGEKLHLDETQSTFKMKGLVNEGGWLYVIPLWMIGHAVEENFIEKVSK